MSSNARWAAGEVERSVPAQETRRSVLARAGLLASGAGIVVLITADQAAAAQVDETLDVVPPQDAPAVRLFPSGAVPTSVSTGGALNLDNSQSTGAGAVLYSNRGSDALGRLLAVNQANPANPMHAVRIQNAGIAHTVSIFHNPAGGAGDATAEAVDIVSTNPLDTTLGIRGQEESRGTVKITHGKPPNPDANAAALSIALEGAGTACQGIFIGSPSGDETTGDLLKIRNGGPGTERLVLNSAGQAELAVEGPGGGLLIGGDANLYRSDVSVLTTDGAFQAGEVRVGGAITLGEQPTDPVAPLVADQALIYMKDRKLVIRWSDGAKALYTTIPLDSRGRHPLVTTDTAAP